MIYAKIEEREMPDGTTEKMLNWGNIVTSPQGLTPEEMGYLPFESVEEAKAYFQIEE